MLRSELRGCTALTVRDGWRIGDVRRLVDNAAVRLLWALSRASDGGHHGRRHGRQLQGASSLCDDLAEAKEQIAQISGSSHQAPTGAPPLKGVALWQ